MLLMSVKSVLGKCVNWMKLKILAFLLTQCKVLLQIWNHQETLLHIVFVKNLNLFGSKRT